MKTKQSILILSAFAALALASCGQGDAPSSSSHSDPASEPASSVASPDSSETGTQPSDSTGSKSESESSSPAELANWEGQTFVGEYKGGFTGVHINTDKTTSWDTGTEKYPAELEVMPNGVFHIHSAAEVDDEHKVDIYTDGTMAYVIHDAVEQDAFVFHKQADYEAANAIAKKRDGSLMFGGVNVGGAFKYFRALNGAYEFDIEIALNNGATIASENAIFEATVAGATATYRVVSAGTNLAIIEDYQIVKTTYAGESGALIVGKNNDEIVFITLDNQAIDLERVEIDEDGNIVVKNGEPTLSDDKLHWVYSATKYTLDGAAYTVTDIAASEDVFHALDMSQNQYSAVVGDDGNLWASFSPTVGGKLTIEESPRATGVDFKIAIFDAAKAPYTSSNILKSEDAYLGSTAETEKITNFQVEAGKNYIIKAGYYSDVNNKEIGSTGSSYKGQTFGISYSFTPFTINTYTNDEHGTLSVELDGATFRGATLNGQALEGATKNGNVISSVAKVVSYENPDNPQLVTTSVTITLNTDGTFTMLTDVASADAFRIITEADSGSDITGTVGTDGNLWVMFTPTSSGYLTVDQKATASADGYIAVYKASASSYKSANAEATGDYGGTASGGGKISNIVLDANVTYIIKSGAFADRDKLLGESGSAFAGQSETFSFLFSSILVRTFTGANGDLILSTDDGEYVSATLGGAAIANGELVDNGDNTLTLTNAGTPTVDNSDRLNPVSNSTNDIYTIDVVGGTYTVQAEPMSRPIFHEVTTMPATVTDTVGADGNLWIKWTAPSEGNLKIDELTPVADDTINVFESTAAAFTYAYGTSYHIAHVDSAYSGGLEHLSLDVEANKTYIIKVGYYSDASKDVTGTGSSYAGKTESVALSFAAKIVKTYTGDNNDSLEMVFNGDTLTSAKLNGTAVDGWFNDDGDFLIPGSSGSGVDVTDPMEPKKSVNNTLYHLNDDNMTFTTSISQGLENIFIDAHESGVYSGVTGADGNLWIRFSPKQTGYLTAEEIVSTTTDGYIAIYHAEGATSTGDFTASTSNAYFIKGDDSSATLSGCGKVSNILVEAGKTYIIKAGSYYVRNNAVTDTADSTRGPNKPESVQLTFTAFDAATYAGENDSTLTVYTYNDEFVSAALNGQSLAGATMDADGNLLVKGTAAYDLSPTNPALNRTDTSYVLNADESSFEVVETPVAESFFKTATGSCTITGTVGDDGNLWIAFTPDADGKLTADEIVSTSTDGYLAIYEVPTADDATVAYYKPANTSSSWKADNGGTASGGGKVSDIEVQAGHTYIIKAGYYYDNSKTIGDGAKSTYAGKSETVQLIFNAYSQEIYQKEGEADIVINKFGDQILSVKLGDETLNVTPENGVITIDKGMFIGEEGNRYSLVLDYVLNSEDGTYEIIRHETQYEAVENGFTVASAEGIEGFSYDEENGKYTSNNAGEDSTTATMTVTISADGYLALDYACWSERNTWDYLTIKITHGGVTTTLVTNVGGIDGMDGKIFIEVHEGDVITITYKKDSSDMHESDDKAEIWNIAVVAVQSESNQD